VGKFSIRLLLSSIRRARQAMGRLLSWSGVPRWAAGGPATRYSLACLHLRCGQMAASSRDVALRWDAALRWSLLYPGPQARHLGRDATSSSSLALHLNFELLASIPFR
jgi:hypothetical protein